MADKTHNPNQTKPTTTRQWPAPAEREHSKRTPSAGSAGLDTAALADPRLASPAQILALQRTAGNRAVSRLIQTKLTVGPAYDRYEQEADQVAQQVMAMPVSMPTQPAVQRAVEEDEEVQTKPLAASITPLRQRRITPLEISRNQTPPLLQRELLTDKMDTLKTSDAQTTAREHEAPSTAKTEVEKQAKEGKRGGVSNPLGHPYFPTFQSRIQTLFSEYPPSPGVEPQIIARNVWRGILGAIEDKGQGTLPKNAQGWVDMAAPAFTEIMNSFNGVMTTLKQISSSEFVKAKTFGFWSKNEAKELAEQKCDLTLETSGIGGLFDGIGSMEGPGWDPQLWGSLSRAYAQAVAEQMSQKGKSIHVFAGGQCTSADTNIFPVIESKALEKGVLKVGKKMEQVVVYHSVARINKDEAKSDLSVHDGMLPGTWASGRDRNEVLNVGNQRFKALPPKPGP